MAKKISISDKAYEFLTEAAKKNNITRTKYIDMKIAEVSKDSVIEHLRALIPHLIRAHGEQHDGEAMSRKTLFKAIYDITQNKYKDWAQGFHKSGREEFHNNIDYMLRELTRKQIIAPRGQGLYSSNI